MEEWRCKTDIRHIEKLSKRAWVNPTLAVIMSNVSKLNTPIKRQKWSKWIFKK